MRHYKITHSLKLLLGVCLLFFLFVPVQAVDMCGILIPGQGDCILFQTLDAGPTGLSYVLDYYDRFVVYDSVCVQGVILDSCNAPCPGAQGCIEVWEITAWESGGYFFEDCGVLIEDDDCLLFESGTMLGGYLLLENYQDFQVDDSVFVSGTLIPSCSLLCPSAVGFLSENSISEGCEPFGSYISSEGVLIDTVGYVLFDPFEQPEDYYSLDNYNGLQIGDTVLVNGILDPDCEPIHPAVTGCVYFNMIIPTGTTYPGELLVQMSPNCPVEPVISDFGGVEINHLEPPNIYLVNFTDTIPLDVIAVALLAHPDPHRWRTYMLSCLQGH